MKITPIKTILFATTSQGKIEEVRSLMEPKGYIVKSLADFKLDKVDEAPENSKTYSGNAMDKAKWYYKFLPTSVPILAEDDGIEVEALNWQPGIYSKRWPIINNSKLDPVDYLLERSSGKRNRTARFRSGMVLYINGKFYMSVETKCDGRITTEKIGNNTHMGFDKIFIPKYGKRTFAEMGVTQKNIYSHRAKAIREIMHQLKNDTHIITPGEENISEILIDKCNKHKV